MSHDFVTRQARDVLPSRAILYVVAVALLVVTPAAVAAAGLLLRAESGGGATRPRPVRAPEQIMQVEQSLIESTRRGLDLRDAQRDALGRYEWVDHDGGVVKIPIDRAIELTVEHAR